MLNHEDLNHLRREEEEKTFKKIVTFYKLELEIPAFHASLQGDDFADLMMR